MYSASWIEFPNEKMGIHYYFTVSILPPFLLSLFFLIILTFSGSKFQEGVLYGKLEMLRCTGSLVGYTDHCFLKSEFLVHLK